MLGGLWWGRFVGTVYCQQEMFRLWVLTAREAPESGYCQQSHRYITIKYKFIGVGAGVWAIVSKRCACPAIVS